METPSQLAAIEIGNGITALPAYMPVPGMGLLGANSFLLDGAEPLVVDTGIAPLAPEFLRTLSGLTPLSRIKWIWLTHMDVDHTGALPALLEAAPEAKIITNFLGAGKLALLGIPAERVHLLALGDELDIGTRRLTAIRPPYFDAPETMGLVDRGSATLFCADAFGALLERPEAKASNIGAEELFEGMAKWAELDSPWMADLAPRRFERHLALVTDLGVKTILSAHLPPASGIEQLLVETARLVQKQIAALTPAIRAA